MYRWSAVVKLKNNTILFLSVVFVLAQSGHCCVFLLAAILSAVWQTCSEKRKMEGWMDSASRRGGRGRRDGRRSEGPYEV